MQRWIAIVAVLGLVFVAGRVFADGAVCTATCTYLPLVEAVPGSDIAPTVAPTDAPTVTLVSTATPAATTSPVPSTATPTPTPMLTSTPTPPLVIESSSTYTRNGKAYIVGEVRNTTSAPLYYVTIHARLYDANGAVVGTYDQEAVFGATYPNQVNPFRFTIANPPAFARYDLTPASQTQFEAFVNLAVVSSTISSANGVTVAGDVRNDSTYNLSQVQVVATFYDTAGAVVDVSVGSIDTPTMSHGATNPYMITTGATFPYATYIVQGQGTVIS